MKLTYGIIYVNKFLIQKRMTISAKDKMIFGQNVLTDLFNTTKPTDQPKPTDQIIQSNPTDQNIQPNPTDQIIQPNPTDQIIQPNPTDQIIQPNPTDQPNSTEQTDSNIIHKYCNKCHMKRMANDISAKETDIFSIVNKIIFDSRSIPEVYEKMDDLHLGLKEWFKLNSDGYTVFHWFGWFISTKIKKYGYIKPRVYAFFQKVFSDNTVKSIFSKKTIANIVKLGTSENPNHTILYHLVRYCENPSDNYYKRFHQLLLDRGSKQLTQKQLEEIKKSNTEEDELPEKIKTKVSEITNNYKNTEELIIKEIELKCPSYELNKCIDCGALIDYTKEISKIIQFAKKNNFDWLINLIHYAYYQRKLLNKIFDQVYNTKNTNSNLNMIHKRHEHILNIYSDALV